MLYRLFINYIRLALLKIILTRVLGRKMGKAKNMKNIKTMSLLTYGLELLAAFYLNGKRKAK